MAASLFAGTTLVVMLWVTAGWHDQLALWWALLAGALGLRVSLGRAWRRQQDLVAQKDNFLASISHELRTPLASVRALTENLAAGTVPDAHDPARRHAPMMLTSDLALRSADRAQLSD